VGEVWAEARFSRFLAGTFIAMRRLPEAERHLRISLAYERELGALREESNALRGLAFVHELQGRPQDALAVLQEFRPRSAGLSGDQEEANYLSALGTAHHRLGEHERALEVCLHAVEVFTRFPDQMPAEAEATVFETLGDVHHELGRHTEAVDGYHEAVRRLRQMRAMKDLAVALVKLARTHIAAGDSETARGHLVEAEAIYEELDAPAVADVRKLLSSLD
jgi:tetratricopeptide (TPR) repeat protein